MPNPVADLDPSYGTIFIGLLFATFFQGVLSVQAYVYYERFPEDSWRLKTLVAVVWIVDTIHLVFSSKGTYHFLVSSWGDPGALVYSHWTISAHLLLLGLATIICQGFFLHRIWMFSNRNKTLITFLLSMCLTTFGLDISMSIQDIRDGTIAEYRNVTPEIISVFSIGAGSDLIIALLLCYYLHNSRSGLPKTNSIITKLVAYAVSTSLVTGLLALACLIAYFASPNTLIFVAMHLSLGRMYTNALLVTLNSRSSLRQKLYGNPKSLEMPASVDIGRFHHSAKHMPAVELQKRVSGMDHYGNLTSTDKTQVEDTFSPREWSV